MSASPSTGPDKLNALSTPLVRALEAELDAIAADRAVRVVILTGAGDRAFVAGADIAEYRATGRRHSPTTSSRAGASSTSSRRCPKPTIAAIRGYALGGGFEIALCCDIIICATSARLGLPEGLLGLSPGGGGTQRLTRAVGKHVASDIMLAARRITGERAFQLGIAAAVVPDEELMPTAVERARAMLKVAPLAAGRDEAAHPAGAGQRASRGAGLRAGGAAPALRNQGWLTIGRCIALFFVQVRCLLPPSDPPGG